ncbi:FAD-binding oxidoreductase [Paenalcaligenes niemegkensis]|uniref:FAD-binding oxidoreductase n=1 Tax=Paenalcaligenes niemegkensis TaxID=2895469 RepID=UPI001EE8783F|nr:FAD-binding oxidoreductase [Paenalcaligenes niemegkensis]MCQ9617740.1 FAD-binding oxidoreductase [Paenalcaligenes niemegkensis]
MFRPRTTQEVADIVRACAVEQRRITIQGGLTGLAGGASPDADDVVVSLERLNQIVEFDEIGGTLTVQAGMVLQSVCEHVENAGWYFPLDFGSRGSCQIGGNVSTNAGGNRVLRYGTARELVLGLEVVLPDGQIVSMLNKGLKNNTGIDLKHLFIGSEGSLGLITKVVLRLFPKPEARYSALVGLESFEQVAALLKSARANLPGLSSFEVMWQDYMVAACGAISREVPFNGEHPLYVLLETEGKLSARNENDLQEWLETQIEAEVVADVILPQSGEQAAQLWHIRDAIGELLAGMAPYVAFDVGVPLSKTPDFIHTVRTKLKQSYPQAQSLYFGHLGDGNLHIVTGPYDESVLIDVEALVYDEISAVGGSISAEHGIGRIKKPFLFHSRNAEELGLMRSLKQLIDPDRRFNAGRIYPD